jgi:cytochrome c biogenesis protein CcdA
MKTIKNLFGMALSIGFINPIFFPDNQYWFQGFAGLLAAFIGSGLIYGFEGYKVNPKKIGNAESMPQINQVWMMFFIGAVANLLWATLYV